LEGCERENLEQKTEINGLRNDLNTSYSVIDRVKVEKLEC
jgi:hypothetical protein